MRFLKKFNETDSSDKGKLFFYCFDWDDNILNMPTQIRLEKIQLKYPNALKEMNF
jgi:hypothetical protein